LKEAAKAGFLYGPEKLFDSAGKKKRDEIMVLKKASEGEFEEQIKKPCTKLELLLSPTQLLMENFPLPGSENCKDFVFTKDDYAPVTESSPMFSIDCEWVLCQDGNFLFYRLLSWRLPGARSLKSRQHQWLTSVKNIFFFLFL